MFRLVHTTPHQGLRAPLPPAYHHRRDHYHLSHHLLPFSADYVRPDLPSKMEKYFDASYDHRLNVAPSSVTATVPATGLIDNIAFEGRDAVLEFVKQR